MLNFFNTLKAKLFFCFFVFVFLTMCVALFSFWFYQRRENIGQVFRQIEHISLKTLHVSQYERDFLSDDAIDTNFYKRGKSEYLARHESMIAEIQDDLTMLKKSDKSTDFDIVKDLDHISILLKNYESTFKQTVSQIKTRGYDWQGLEGKLHKLNQQISRSNLAANDWKQLKELEKNYITHREAADAKNIELLCKKIIAELPQKLADPKIAENKKHIEEYLSSFHEFASIDQRIGNNHSFGLKKKLKDSFEEVEKSLAATAEKANEQEVQLQNKFKYTFLAILISAIAIGIIFSYVITNQITQPISQLSSHINSIAERGFSGEITSMPIKTRDEVGILTRNFNLMTGQIQQHLQEINKKSKVLQKQNMQLQSINLKLISSENKLRSLNSVKDKFFSIISHDLKGPLHTLTGFLQILIKYTSTFTEAEIKEFAESMDVSVKRLLTMLENLLQWSRSQTGNIEHKPETLQLSKILEDNINLLTETAKNKNISLILESDDHTFVKADKNMLDFILRNLISNAIKFTRTTGEVRVIAVPGIDFTEIIVKDNGVGISTEDMKKIFQHDVHFSTSGTGKEKGTGFGLLLCKDFVEKNGGEISIESFPGKGTSLTFTVPTVQEQILTVEK